jgi:hypothetical protein
MMSSGAETQHGFSMESSPENALFTPSQNWRGQMNAMTRKEHMSNK